MKRLFLLPFFVSCVVILAVTLVVQLNLWMNEQLSRKDAAFPDAGSEWTRVGADGPWYAFDPVYRVACYVRGTGAGNSLSCVYVPPMYDPGCEDVSHDTGGLK
jgi:hypothetical protein